MQITFTTKESYLAWRTEWKRCYTQVTENIRSLKRVQADVCRAQAKAGQHWLYPEKVAAYLDKVPGHAERQERILKEHLWLKRERQTACDLLVLRVASKMEAQRLYLAAHPEKAVA